MLSCGDRLRIVFGVGLQGLRLPVQITYKGSGLNNCTRPLCKYTITNPRKILIEMLIQVLAPRFRA